jgi:predicted transposase/invertase (TIGR01784 family)
MIDHDRLFKELLSTFLLEFLDLFVPDLAHQIERDSLSFLPQEYFADLTTGEKKVVDLLAQVRMAGQEAGFLIHIENQAASQADFTQRMFFYFARLHQKYRERIYPIVVFSFDQPYREEAHQYTVNFETFKVLEFNFVSIQLNRLAWRDFLSQSNPVAAALMAKMQIEPVDRPKVKAECLRMLVTLKLDPARAELISGFIDAYLRLNESETRVFTAEIDKLETEVRENVMQIMTSWTEQGIEQGIKQGKEQATRALILRLLHRRVGDVPQPLEARVRELSLEELEALGEALLDFAGVADLEQWLAGVEP